MVRTVKLRLLQARWDFEDRFQLNLRSFRVGDEAAGAMGAGVLPRGLEADGEEAEPQRLLHVRGHHRAAA